jgi:2'-5' RNA ligase
MPAFSSFEAAWSAFLSAEALMTFEESTAALTRGRAQAIAFTVPIEDPGAAAHIERVQDEIAAIPGLSLTPPEEFHITLKVAGFQVIRRTMDDDILREEVPHLDRQAGAFFQAVRSFSVRLEHANVFPGCIILEVDDGGVLRHLNAALSEHLPGLHRYATDSPNYLPHVTIATIEDDTDAAQLRRTLPGLRNLEPVPVPVRRIDLSRAWFLGGGREMETIKSYYLQP